MRMIYFWMVVATVLLGFCRVSAADEQAKLRLVSDEKTIATGIWSYVLPRFGLKTGILVELTSTGTDEITRATMLDQADVVVFTSADPENSGIVGNAVKLFFINGVDEGPAIDTPLYLWMSYDTGAQSGDHAPVQRLKDWLTSTAGLNTFASYRHQGRQVYFVTEPAEQESEVIDLPGDADKGANAALRHCGRCHVIGPQNKYGGIDSTPSFPALVTIADWRERFLKFWTLNPHPSFTQIQGITDPFDPARPPAIYPISLTVEELDNIGAFLLTIIPKDLGAEIMTK